MDPRSGMRVAAVVVLAGAMLACALDVARIHRDGQLSAASANTASDPLATELLRCKAPGTDAANDAACKDAWAKSRERFFTPGQPYQHRPVDSFPLTPDLPEGPPAKDEIHRTPPRPPASTPSTSSDGR